MNFAPPKSTRQRALAAASRSLSARRVARRFKRVRAGEARRPSGPSSQAGSARERAAPFRWQAQPGLTISFSDEIPVFSGNEISFRNFGEFWPNFFEF